MCSIWILLPPGHQCFNKHISLGFNNCYTILILYQYFSWTLVLLALVGLNEEEDFQMLVVIHQERYRCWLTCKSIDILFNFTFIIPTQQSCGRDIASCPFVGWLVRSWLVCSGSLCARFWYHFLSNFNETFQECLFAWSSQFLSITGMICHASVILGLKIANFCENRIKIHKKFISCTNFLDPYRLARGTLNLLDCLSVRLLVCPSHFSFPDFFLDIPWDIDLKKLVYEFVLW